ncbi:TIM-barrel domain-containing protein [Actinomadura sp. KC345]|uniref:TIM-barrel domain-containing protein n=1 Tax=Actinomadura sp. KC345 TaxID=2530371 RepID=UPI0014043E54|nr:TIM-barrel domain-containing protein [Actinomadura sp. KC345]
MLTYVNPFLVDPSGKPGGVPRNLFAEARDRGYLVARADGSPYMLDQSEFSAAMVDFTNPAARDWYARAIATEVAGAGADGWMADFGEALPFDARLHAGSPADLHNRRPVEWAKVNRRACALAGKPDCLSFMRAAYTGSPAHAPLFWAGDQLVGWDAQDGLASALHGMLSAGVSGMTLNHTDIGGYTAVDTPLGDHHRLVAPVLKPGASSVAVHLPAGRWTNVFTGRSYGDRTRDLRLTVPAPLGTPAAFVRAGDPEGAKIRTALHRAGLTQS